MKKNLFKVLAVAILGISMASCSNPSKMAKEADLVTVESNPQVLEVVADEITATYSMSFPEDYFHPKAILEITPVLVYEGGEAEAPVFKLQGEKITDNFQTILKSGGSASRTISFDYVPGMEKSHLELRVAVWNKLKKYDFPAPYKLADGANFTYKMVSTKGMTAIAPDQYQKVIRETKESQILYTINSSYVRPQELTKEEIKEFKEFLARMKEDERREVKSTNIVAYASPDGPTTFNSKLSDKRGETAKKAFDKVTKDVQPDAPVNVSTIAEDWEGFQELVKASSIQDKELILRVLSMYSDPVVREREIKNMSEVFQTLADKILPELRRARMIANVDYTNYSDEELIQLASTNVEIMDVEALLYTATLVEDYNTKAMLYKKAGDKFECDRGYNNLAAIALGEDKLSEAKSALAKVSDKTTPFYYNNAGVVALREKDYDKAAELFAKSSLKEATYNYGVIDILNGKYNEAASKLAGAGNSNEVIAYILTNQLDKASNVFKPGMECPRSSYLKAIIAARKGNMTEVAKQLEVARQDEALRARSERDIEFAKFRE
jgi:outer membrane protein OmpA-like peptidoglycan-associated protein